MMNRFTVYISCIFCFIAGCGGSSGVETNEASTSGTMSGATVSSTSECDLLEICPPHTYGSCESVPGVTLKPCQVSPGVCLAQCYSASGWLTKPCPPPNECPSGVCATDGVSVVCISGT